MKTLQAGVKGYLLKNGDASERKEAIITIHRHNTYYITSTHAAFVNLSAKPNINDNKPLLQKKNWQ